MYGTQRPFLRLIPGGGCVYVRSVPLGPADVLGSRPRFRPWSTRGVFSLYLVMRLERGEGLAGAFLCARGVDRDKAATIEVRTRVAISQLPKEA